MPPRGKGTKPAARRRSRIPREERRNLDLLLDDALTDAYGDGEQRVGIFTMLEDNLCVPFRTRVLGVEVVVEGVDMNDGDEIVAVCRAGKELQRVPVLDLPLPSPPPRGAEWISVYRLWLGRL